MINSLEEAIKHCEEVAETKEKEGSLNQESFMPLNEFLRYRVECLKCAKEHRQLAKWLKELKAYKDARVGCEYCKDRYRERYERPCSLCKRNFVDMFEREVNADE